MTRVLFVGQDPETVNFADPAFPPGMSAEKIHAGIAIAMGKMAERQWIGEECMIAPDQSGLDKLAKVLATGAFDCVVIGAGLRVPPNGMLFFERVINVIHRSAPGAPIAFNTRPEDTADAAGRQLRL